MPFLKGKILIETKFKHLYPIFLGMIFTFTGFFLAMPNVLTLVILVLGFVLMQIQVRLEEGFLVTIHGEGYLEFRRQVRRWL